MSDAQNYKDVKTQFYLHREKYHFYHDTMNKRINYTKTW